MKNEYKVTKPLLRRWMTENMYKGVQLGLNIGWAFFGVLCTVLLIVDAETVTDYIIYGALLALCLYMAVLRIFPLTAVQYKRMAKTYGEENWLRTIDFGEDCITLSEGTISAKYQYKDIMQIREKGNAVWLTARNRTVLRLYKDAFVDSSWEECEALLNDRKDSV